MDGTQPQYGHSPPTSRASTPATDEASLGQPPGGVLAAWAHAEDDDIDLVLGHAASPQGCIGPGSQGMTGWNCSDGDHVCYYVPGSTDTDGVIDDL